MTSRSAEAPRQRNPKQINVVPDSTKRDRKLRIAKTSSLRSQNIRQAIRNRTSVKNITQKTDLNAHVQTADIARQRNSPFLMSRCGECSTGSVRLEVNTNTNGWIKKEGQTDPEETGWEETGWVFRFPLKNWGPTHPHLERKCCTRDRLSVCFPVVLGGLCFTRFSIKIRWNKNMQTA